MRVQEFGQQNDHVILLPHGGGLSWWNYHEVAKILSSQYHVVLPVLDGHADSDASFTTIEENAARLITYIDTHWGGQVLAIGGLSLGGQIAVEMLSQRKDICRYALLESALVKPRKLTAALIGPAFGMSFSIVCPSLSGVASSFSPHIKRVSCVIFLSKSVRSSFTTLTRQPFIISLAAL